MADDTISGFRYWQGVGGIWYGQRLRASPPVVLRAESLADLRGMIDAWLSDHPSTERYYWHPAPDTY